MAEREQRLAAARERDGDPAVDLAEPRPRVPEAPMRAVLADQRMQPPGIRPAAAYRLEEAGEGLHGAEPAQRVVAAQHLVEQRRVHPLEQAGIERELAVVGLDALPQARFHPVLHDAPRLARLRGGAGVVAPDAQRHRPARRLLGQRVELAPRQAPIEEIADLAIGEAQLVRADHRGLPVEDRARDVEPGGKMPAGGGEVQVGRPALDQEIEQRHRSGVAEPVQVVEDEDEGLAAGLERVREQRGPASGRAVALRGVLDGEPGVLEGEGDVGIEHLGIVARIDRDPGGDGAALGEPAAALGEQRGLAEPAGSHQHGQAVARRHRPLHQPLAVDVALHAVGHGHLAAQQPGEAGLGVEFAAGPLARRERTVVLRHACRPGPAEARAARTAGGAGAVPFAGDCSDACVPATGSPSGRPDTTTGQRKYV